MVPSFGITKMVSGIIVVIFFPTSAKTWVKNSTSIQVDVIHSFMIYTFQDYGVDVDPHKMGNNWNRLTMAHMMSPLQRVTGYLHSQTPEWTLQFSCGFMLGMYLFLASTSQHPCMVQLNEFSPSSAKTHHGATQKRVTKMAIYAWSMKE